MLLRQHFTSRPYAFQLTSILSKFWVTFSTAELLIKWMDVEWYVAFIVSVFTQQLHIPGNNSRVQDYQT